MLLRNLDELFNNPASFMLFMVTIIIALVIGVTFHEFSHAFTARVLGDRTAQKLGRLSLNPLAHLDPAGSLMMLIAGFGWGKPVPVNHQQLKHGRQGMALVALAGPASNILLAAAVALLFQTHLLARPSGELDIATFTMSTWVAWIALYTVLINIVLAVFNMLPLMPLDGSQVVMGIAPRRLLPSLFRLQKFGPVVLVGILLLDMAFGLGILGRVLNPVVNWATRLLLS